MVIPREPQIGVNTVRGHRRDYTQTPQMTKAYIVGILHDATQRKTTYRVSQKSEKFVKFVQKGIKNLGGNAWIYKEGKSRNVYIVEFSKSLLAGTKIQSKKEKIDYIRGYFDTDGSVAKNDKIRYYIYFCQKDFDDLSVVRNYLVDQGIDCGEIHNPGKRVDPFYWRFFIRAKSYYDFAEKIGSWHPEKSKFLRMKR